jgi:hypothetical protein
MGVGGDLGEMYLVQGMSALWDDVRFLTGQAEGEGEGFEADGALPLVVHVVSRAVLVGSGDHRVWMDRRRGRRRG